MITMKVSQHYPVTFSGSDGSTPNGINKSYSTPGIVSAQLGASTGTVTAIGVGSTTITYSATGYNPVTEDVTVEALPDLIVTDLAMPVMDGRQFRREQLKRRPPCNYTNAGHDSDGRSNSY